MKHVYDEFLAACGVGLVGMMVWSLFLAYLSTHQLQPW